MNRIQQLLVDGWMDEQRDRIDERRLMITLPKTNIDPENGWLEDELSFWDTIFSEAMLVSGRVLGGFSQPSWTKIIIHGNLRVHPLYHPSPQGNKALILRPYFGIMVVNNPLIRPAIFWGKCGIGENVGPLEFPNEMMIWFSPKDRRFSEHQQKYLKHLKPMFIYLPEKNRWSHVYINICMYL